MDFTGERFTPDCVREIWYEHFHRYIFALPLVEDARVLDLACGEGYGSHLLGKSASQVLGMDIDQASIDHAQRHYADEHVQFRQGSAQNTGLDSGCMDAIVSFETIEHLTEQEQMLDEFARVLRPDGTLLISSPDKHVYSEVLGTDNPYHLKELYFEEFDALLSSRFSHTAFFGQSLGFFSLIQARNGGESSRYQRLNRQTGQLQSDQPAPVYWIAICSNEPERVARAEKMALHLFSDVEQSIYRHYQAEIENGILAAQIIAEQKQRIAELEAKIAESRKS